MREKQFAHERQKRLDRKLLVLKVAYLDHSTLSWGEIHMRLHDILKSDDVVRIFFADTNSNYHWFSKRIILKYSFLFQTHARLPLKEGF